MPAPARRRHRLATFLAVAASLLVLSVVAGPALPPRPRLASLASVSDRHQTRILRDTWGVPHVFGKTDADAAYGLAWAHAEDDFATIQRQLVATRGKLASVIGRDGAVSDYVVKLLRVRDTVEARYATDLSPETRAVVEGYADGINHYAGTHPRDAWPGLYPVSGMDVIAGFVASVPLFYDLDKTLRELMGPSAVRPVSRKGEAVTTSSPFAGEIERGSNGIAVAPQRSADGFTRLAVNSHQPWQGPLAWYEAHLHSEEGWDTVGGLMPGSPVILQGHNRDLGWTFTVNRPDFTDVYALTMNPRNASQYHFDGEWRDLEVRQVPIVVKLWGGFQWTFEREALWSVHGPVVRTPHGTYAIRYAAMGDLRAVEQWYRMNKARSRDEWLAAMRIGGIPNFNVVYADREGHIGYFYNARLPKRAEGYDWSQYLPGDRSETLWTETLAFDEMPQVQDPPSGFVASANSTPFQVTAGEGNPDPARWSKTFGMETHLTNRQLRALELLGGDSAITGDAFERYKFDTAYSTHSLTALRLKTLRSAAPPLDPLAREGQELLRRFDLRTDPDNPAAALAVLTLRPNSDNRPAPVAADELVRRLEQSAHQLKNAFGRLDVPWGEVNRLRRGTVDLPLGGAPDVLRAIYGARAEDGRIVATGGDSYVLLVEWDREGRVHSRSIHPFGSATLAASSPHYADQSPLFARGELKPVWLDEREIRAHLSREYRPGE
ncbi:MAG: acylase [Solirubrobacterales bacterium]|jgi:penicillin amidase/acyl-homoserine-lactone acylase